jgi:signal transduction histidine kinase
MAAGSQRNHRVGRMQTAIFHLLVQSAVHTLDRLQFSPWYADQEARPSTTFDGDMEVQAVRMYLLQVFVSGIIHDLNNAMAVISGRLDLLVHRLEDQVVSRHLLAAQHASLEVTRLIRDLHSFMPGDHQGDMELVDINQLVRDSLQIAGSNWFQEFRERRVPVELQADLQPVPAFPSRASDMRIALLGLLRHAMDTLRPGGGLMVRTSVVEEAEGQRVAVSFADAPHPPPILERDAGRGILRRPAMTPASQLILEGVQAIVRDLAGQITVDQHSDGGTVTSLTFSVGRMSPGAG